MSRGYPDTAEVLAKRFNIPKGKIHKILYSKYFNQAAGRKITQKKAWQLAAKELNLPLSWQETRDLHIGLIKVNKPVFDLAKKLRKKYVTLMLSKNTRSQFFASKNKLPYVWKGFDFAINTWELNLPKASKKTILTLAKRFKVKPSEILYIDDQEDNLVEPKKLGVKTIFYQNFYQFRKELNNILK
jgi:FMN phosphatase YigB (HAD superfamily)